MTHAAVLMTAPFAPLVIEEMPAPVLEPGAALLRTLYSEVCGAHVHLHHPTALSPETFIGGGCRFVTALDAVDMVS